MIGVKTKHVVAADMHSTLLLHVSGIVSETKKSGWACLQTVALPAAKCLVQSGKTDHKNQTISRFLRCQTRQQDELEDLFVFKTSLRATRYKQTCTLT